MRARKRFSIRTTIWATAWAGRPISNWPMPTMDRPVFSYGTGPHGRGSMWGLRKHGGRGPDPVCRLWPAGLWRWDGSSWTQVNVGNPETMVVSNSILYANFGASGYWSWDGSTWTQINVGVPENVAVAGSVLYGDFGPAGLWCWNGSTWDRINVGSPGTMVSPGTVLYADFGPAGLWCWNGNIWNQINVGVPENMVASATTLYGDFGSAGLWSWDGTAWSPNQHRQPWKHGRIGCHFVRGFWSLRPLGLEREHLDADQCRGTGEHGGRGLNPVCQLRGGGPLDMGRQRLEQINPAVPIGMVGGL